MKYSPDSLKTEKYLLVLHVQSDTVFLPIFNFSALYLYVLQYNQFKSGVLLLPYRRWWTNLQYQSTRWRRYRSLASSCSTTAYPRRCGTGSFCWLPSTWPSPYPTTLVSPHTMTPSLLPAPPSSVTS